jgi:hypothetical protein
VAVTVFGTLVRLLFTWWCRKDVPAPLGIGECGVEDGRFFSVRFTLRRIEGILSVRHDILSLEPCREQGSNFLVDDPSLSSLVGFPGAVASGMFISGAILDFVLA